MPTDPNLIAAIATMAALKGIAFQEDFSTAGPDGLVLRSESIGTKFGFSDGDCPDPVRDMVDAWYGHAEYVGGKTWHPVLWDLVNEHLVPALGDTDLDLYLMSTIHNPIRSGHRDLSHMPSDVEVTVPWLTVLAHVIIAIDAAFADHQRTAAANSAYATDGH